MFGRPSPFCSAGTLAASGPAASAYEFSVNVNGSLVRVTQHLPAHAANAELRQRGRLGEIAIGSGGVALLAPGGAVTATRRRDLRGVTT